MKTHIKKRILALALCFSLLFTACFVQIAVSGYSESETSGITKKVLDFETAGDTSYFQAENFGDKGRLLMDMVNTPAGGSIKYGTNTSAKVMRLRGAMGGTSSAESDASK